MFCFNLKFESIKYIKKIIELFNSILVYIQQNRKVNKV